MPESIFNQKFIFDVRLSFINEFLVENGFVGYLKIFFLRIKNKVTFKLNFLALKSYNISLGVDLRRPQL